MDTNKTVIYEIWQTHNAEKQFLSLNMLEKGKDEINLFDYEKVYTGKIKNNYDNTKEILEYLFELFNVTRPKGYTGHSMSVSDIVKVNNEWWYCDTFGFSKLEDL